MVRYKSKVDSGLIVAISLGITPIFIFAFSQNFAQIISCLVGAFIFYFAFIKMMYYEHYIIDSEKGILNVSKLFSARSIIIADIIEINKKTQLLSTKTSSFDAIEIISKGNYPVIISPKRKKNFVAHIQRLSPKISVDL